MLIIKTTDFTGFQGLASSVNSNPVLQAYIDLYEKKYLMRLLSETMGNLFIANIDPTTHLPVASRWLDLFNSFDKQDTDNSMFCEEVYFRENHLDSGKGMRHSDGIKQLLLNCVFYHYVFDTDNQSSQSGITKSSVDAAKSASASRFAERRFNVALDTWDSIKWFILQNTTTYPEYVKTNTPGAKYSAIL